MREAVSERVTDKFRERKGMVEASRDHTDRN